MAEHQHFSNSESSNGLKNGLKSRHLTMISIAGVIGGALFVGSGNVIYSAGPAALIGLYFRWTISFTHHAYAGRNGGTRIPTAVHFQPMQIVESGAGPDFPSAGYTGLSGRCSWAGKPLSPGKS